jgi:hypothetical protein
MLYRGVLIQGSDVHKTLQMVPRPENAHIDEIQCEVCKGGHIAFVGVTSNTGEAG